MDLNNINDTQPNTSGSGFGAQFKNARTKQKLSVNDVVKELNILERHIEAIERNDFDSLPQLAFTRGFVMSYAKFLKLDVNNVMSHFESIYPQEKAIASKEIAQPTQVDNKKLGKVSRNNNNKASFGRFTLILALLGLIGLGFIYFTSSKKTQLAANTKEESQTVIEQMDDNSQTAIGTEIEPIAGIDSNEQTSEQNAQNNTTTDANTQTETTTQNAATDTTTEETVVADPNAKPAELVFWVIKQSDITITDQTGAVIMSGNHRRGEHKAVGKPPFKLSISNASKVRLNMNKIPIKLNKYTNSSNVADFTLNK